MTQSKVLHYIYSYTDVTVMLLYMSCSVPYYTTEQGI